MRRIDSSIAADVQQDAFGVGKHGFQPGDPGTGRLATEVPAEWLNTLQEELAGLVEGYGVGLDANVKNQIASLLLKTQLQFDSSKKLATTEFVQRALGNNQTAVQLAVGVTTNLTAGQAGSYIQCQGGTVKLPPTAGLSLGTRFAFSSSSNTAVMVAAGDVMGIGGQSLTQIDLENGDFCELVYMGQKYWQIINTSVLKYSPGISLGRTAYAVQSLTAAQNVTYTNTLTLVAPCNGKVLGIASVNLSSNSSISNSLLFNGVVYSMDVCPSSLNNINSTPVTRGATLTVSQQVRNTGSTTSLAMILNYIFIPGA